MAEKNCSGVRRVPCEAAAGLREGPADAMGDACEADVPLGAAAGRAIGSEPRTGVEDRSEPRTGVEERSESRTGVEDRCELRPFEILLSMESSFRRSKNRLT